MIEKENGNKQKLTPTAAVYRPPAARLADSRRSTEDVTKSADQKRARVRRPDQQMYVPRPKRASFGNDQPRSRSRSSSRTSLDNDIQDKKSKCSPSKNNVLKHSDLVETTLTEQIKPLPTDSKKSSINFVKTKCESSYKSTTETTKNTEIRLNNCVSLENATVGTILQSGDAKDISALSPESNNTSINGSGLNLTETTNVKDINSPFSNDSNFIVDEKQNVCGTADAMLKKEFAIQGGSEIERLNDSSMKIQGECYDSLIKSDTINLSKPEAMETISISSDSQEDQVSSVSAESYSDSINNSSSDSDIVYKQSRNKSVEEMEIDLSNHGKKKALSIEDRSSSHEQNLKNRRIFPNLPVSDVLIISDSSSSNDIPNPPKKRDIAVNIGKEPAIKDNKVCAKKEEKSTNKKKVIDPSDCDWESLYDDSGECLVPDLMEELTKSVGKVRVTSVDSDYRPYQTIEERSNDGECVIEIYDFPAEFKTTDLFNIFAAYRNKNFQIKWVDDTHALGVFPSPLMADEVLACTLPFVKTRPLRLGIVESRNKARNLVLPPLPSMERPKTCTALARRLVTGALGLRIPTSSQEREKEKQVLKEAREKRRLEAKQREAAWDGTLTSNSCI